MGIKFHPDDVRHEISLPKILEKEKHGLKIDEIKKILGDIRIRKKALYLAQLSSGMRIGELVRLRKKHLDFSTNRIMVKIPAEFTKLGRARTTFFSKEFEKLYLFKLKQLDDNDLIFANNEHWEYARENETQNMQEVCKRNWLKDITTHSFRAYFITKISRLDPNLAKLFAGQKGYLLQYDRLDDEEKLAKYIEFEPELLVFTKKVDESKELQEIKESLEEAKTKLAKHDDYMELIANGLINIRKPDDPKFKYTIDMTELHKVLKSAKNET